jgi:hypothetical protein
MANVFIEKDNQIYGKKLKMDNKKSMKMIPFKNFR